MEDSHALQSTVIFRHESVLKARQPSELEASLFEAGAQSCKPARACCGDGAELKVRRPSEQEASPFEAGARGCKPARACCGTRARS